MPNWCLSNVNIHASQESVKKLNEEFKKALSNGDTSDFGKGWLGNLLLHIGIPEYIVTYGDIRCRGQVDDWSCEDTEISMAVTSAWRPHIYCIKKFVDNFVDDAEIYYDAEEEGCGLYWTNDPKIAGKVNVNAYDAGDLPDEYSCFMDMFILDKNDVMEELCKLLHHTGDFRTLANEFEKNLEEAYPDSYIYFYEYEFVEISKEWT